MGKSGTSAFRDHWIRYYTWNMCVGYNIKLKVQDVIMKVEQGMIMQLFSVGPERLYIIMIKSGCKCHSEGS